MKDETLLTQSVISRMEKYTDMDGKMHPYDAGLGQCWEWRGYRLRFGYGRISIKTARGKRKMLLAHRVAKAIALCPVPDGILARHTCDNPSCVNPGHIIAGNHEDNIFDREVSDRNKTKRGEQHYRAILSQEDVFSIMRDPRSCREIAKSYKISSSSIISIKSKKSWNHLDFPIVKKNSFGSSHYNSKLSEENIVDIRRGILSPKEYAEKYGVSVYTVYNIIKRKTWKSVA